MTLQERLGAAHDGLAVGPGLPRAFLRASGTDALDFLHRMSTQDLNRLRPGESAYAAFLSPRGHLLGEGHVLVREGDVLLAVEPGALAGTKAHLEGLVIMDDVLFEDLSPGLRGREGIPGPSGADETRAAQGATTEDTSLVSEGGATQRRDADRPIRRREGISSRPLWALPVFGPSAAARCAAAAPGVPAVPTTRRGAPCVELWLAPEALEPVRAALVGSGALSLSPEDLEVLRVLGGVARWGVDMDERRLPMEAGLTREAISFTKGCYVGQETVMRATARGHLQRGLVQLSLPPSAAAGARLLAAGQEVGEVTSAVDAPQGRVGLGYVRRAHWQEGSRLATEGGEAVVVRTIAWEPER